jgi:hypothetical protein
MQKWFVLAAAALIAAPVIAQDSAAIPPTLNEQMNTLIGVTETMRGLDTLTPVERRFPTRDETIAYLTALYDASSTPEELSAWEAFYRATGMLGPEQSLRDTYLRLLGAQVGGFYDPGDKSMNVLPALGDDVGSTLSITEQVVFVHEYVHALQDQHFGLDALDSPAVTATPDSSLAARALVEGDASAVMNLFAQDVMLQNPALALQLLAEGALNGTLTLPPGIPAGLTRELLFPYEDGMAFVLALYQAGGWDAINAAYAALPSTSEHILHPETYLRGEDAQSVAPYGLGTALGEGWSLAWASPLGEFYLREWLRQFVPADLARAAAAGWGGDWFEVYRHDASGDLAWALTTAWDSPAEAEEFSAVLARAVAQPGRTLAISGNSVVSTPAGVALEPRP